MHLWDCITELRQRLEKAERQARHAREFAGKLESRAKTLDRVEAQWDRRVALGVVLAAAGYPEAPRKGDEIHGLPRNEDDFHVFHAGTTARSGKVVTNGGRVLCVTALGDKVKIAAERAYEIAERIHFEGMQYRNDIGHRAFGRR